MKYLYFFIFVSFLFITFFLSNNLGIVRSQGSPIQDLENIVNILLSKNKKVIYLGNKVKVFNKKDLNEDPFFYKTLIEYTDIKYFFNKTLPKELLSFNLESYKGPVDELWFYFPIRSEVYYSLYSQFLYNRTKPLLKLKEKNDNVLKFLKKLYDKFYKDNKNDIIITTKDKYSLLNLPNNYNVDCKSSIYIWFLVNRFKLGKAFLIKAKVEGDKYVKQTYKDIMNFIPNHLYTIILTRTGKVLIYDVYSIEGVFVLGDIINNKFYVNSSKIEPYQNKYYIVNDLIKYFKTTY